LDPEKDYVFLFEDKSFATYFSGQNDFQLEKHKTELGKDYKRIIMYVSNVSSLEIR